MTIRLLLLASLSIALPLKWAVAAPICGEVFEATPTEVQLQKVYTKLIPEDEKSLYYRAGMGLTYFGDEGFNYDAKLAKADSVPQALFAPNNSDPTLGGSTLFHGDVFVEGYFRVIGLQKKSTETLNTLQLGQQETWLQWHADKGKYTLEHGHAQLELLKSYMKDGQVKIYRGLGEAEVQNLRGLKAGNKKILSQLFTTTRDALFFTPDINTAKKWAKGYYVEITLAAADLEKVYAGIEYDYVEVAIGNNGVLDQRIQSLVVYPQKQKP